MTNIDFGFQMSDKRRAMLQATVGLWLSAGMALILTNTFGWSSIAIRAITGFIMVCGVLTGVFAIIEND